MANLRVPASRSSLTIVDTLWTFSIQEYAREQAGRPVVTQFGSLGRTLDLARAERGLRPADATFALASVDEKSPSQARFTEALASLGWQVEAIDFRSTVPSTPNVDRAERMTNTLSPSVCYLLGLTAGRPDPEVVVCSGSFDLFRPLMDFVVNRGGRAVLAYFFRGLDPRWLSTGRLLSPASPIGWFDLEPYSSDILGVDLTRVSDVDARSKDGLSAW
ncbi:MAG: hypothetical protein IT193_10530 [Propionibacteriaceae bacterium]|nr:hypothetical protein [Propionibacteriaceae bacterium]